jgi:putative flippase GtrA
MGDQMQNTISTRYLMTMISFLVGALTLIKGFERLVQSGLSTPIMIKLAICFALFLPACYVINKYSYFQDTTQHKHLMSLKLSFSQVLISLVTLILLVFVRIALFGTS